MKRAEFQEKLAAIFSSDGLTIGGRVWWMDASWGLSTGILTNWTNAKENRGFITLDDARTRVMARVRMWDNPQMVNH